MNNLILVATVVLFAFAVFEVSAICCGYGSNGYCKDCSKVSLTGKRKCCGIGSGSGHGCNIFCCSCGACRPGDPKIKKKSGWWFGAHYTCEQKKSDSAESVAVASLRDTWNAFHNIDRDEDNEISYDEFVTVMKTRLVEDENAYLLASEILKTDDVNEIDSFLDMMTDDSDEDSRYVANVFNDEFDKMDADGDGKIQAPEFDVDLA